MLVFLVLFFYFFLLFFYNFCFVTRWVARRAWCGWRTSGNISWCWGASMSPLRSFSNVEVEKSLLHNEERVLGLQYNTRCVLENWGEKRVNTNAQWTIYLTDPHASLWWLHLSSVIPLFQSMVFPVVAAVQYILPSCHLVILPCFSQLVICMIFFHFILMTDGCYITKMSDIFYELPLYSLDKCQY